MIAAVHFAGCHCFDLGVDALTAIMRLSHKVTASSSSSSCVVTSVPMLVRLSFSG